MTSATAEQIPDRKVVLAFLAHPDDAEIFCGGTLIRLQELGWEVHITTVANGDCGSATLPKEEIARIRYAEGITAAEFIGGTYHCLDEPDVNVVFDKPTIRKATDLFRQFAPTLVITHPLHDYMLDHEQVHQLARRAAFSYAIPNASELPLIAGSAVPWLYYCDPMEGNNPYTGKPVKPSCLLDITQQMERKLEMLACHASQREWLRSHHGIDEYLDATRRHSRLRGEQLQTEYAEAFVQHAGHPYPQSDLLYELLGSQ